jgi:pyridoxine 4-dehydrogenase
MLSGHIKSLDDLPKEDSRRYFPRFQPENFPINLQLVTAVQTLAKTKGCTAAQLAICWTKSLAKKPGMPLIVPIPGSTVDTRVRENCQEFELTTAELSEIDEILARFEVVGERYPDSVPVDG